MADGDDNGTTAGQGPSLNVLAQYVKDFSFENPDAPNSLRPRDQAPRINIGINVNANRLTETDFEVALKLEATALEGDKPLFATELVYAGVFRLAGIPADQIQPLVMIECPRLLFPFARQIVADATRNGGFPPLMIDPVDFVSLYRDRIAAEAPQTLNA